ncbi:MAG: Do family serine endopeptidase [Spirochaetota bacterium]|nr:Do family serine endopeptidase [Spirochaetota bacterium]
MRIISYFKNNKKRVILVPITLLLVFVLPYFYQTLGYGDKQDVLREIERNNTNQTVLRDEKSLETALAVQKAIRNVAQSVSPSVVNIRTERLVKRGNRMRDPFADLFDRFGDQPFGRKRGPQKLQSLGSGFVVSKKGYIVTNNHVIQGADEITILFSDEKEYKGKIVGRDQRTDIAVIKIEPKHELPVTPLGNSDKVNIGDFAIAIGNPFGLKGTFTLGVISARGRDNVDQDAGLKNYIQTDASINQGNSGGPLLNIRGQAIGMNTAIYSTTGGSVGIGFAIPMNIVKRVVASLIEKGVVERGYLGVSISPIPTDVAKYLNVNKKTGIFVHEVEADGPADRAGIKPGDVILKVNNRNVATVSQLQRIVSSYRKGEKAVIQIFRNGKRMNVNVILGLSETKITRKGKKYIGPSQEFLGLVVGSVKDNFQFYRIDKKLKGVVVVDVEPGSAAEASEIQKGDVIQSINYTDIKTMKDFNRFVKKHKNKKGPFLIKVVRKGKNHFVAVEKK